MRAPFFPIGSLAICTRISWPSFRRSVISGTFCGSRRRTDAHLGVRAGHAGRILGAARAACRAQLPPVRGLPPAHPHFHWRALRLPLLLRPRPGLPRVPPLLPLLRPRLLLPRLRQLPQKPALTRMEPLPLLDHPTPRSPGHVLHIHQRRASLLPSLRMPRLPPALQRNGRDLLLPLRSPPLPRFPLNLPLPQCSPPRFGDSPVLLRRRRQPHSSHATASACDPTQAIRC